MRIITWPCSPGALVVGNSYTPSTRPDTSPTALLFKGHEGAPQPYNLFGIITITIVASILGVVCDGLDRCPWALHFDKTALKPGLYVASGRKTEPPRIIGLCKCANGTT